MCYRNDFVFGDRYSDRDRRSRRERFICDCREVRGSRDRRYDRCNCRDCRRRRNDDLVCRCREI